MSDIGDWFSDFWAEYGYEVGATLAVIVAGIVVLMLIRGAVRRWLSRVQSKFVESDEHDERERGQRYVTITQVVRIVSMITVWLVVGLTVMAIWGLPLGPLVAVGATLGVGLGFGAQSFVADVIGGFFVLVEDQYRVGDVVRISDVSGQVEEITLRTTVLRDLDGNRHHVPNGHDSVVTNLTSEWTRVVIDTPVSYDTDLDQAMRVIEEEARTLYGEEQWEGSFLEEPVMLGVERLDGSSISIRLLLTTVGDDQWPIRRALLKRLKERLDAEGIEIPYQYINVIHAYAGSPPDESSAPASSSGGGVESV